LRQLSWLAEALGYDLVSLLLRRLPVDAASAIGAAVLERLGPLTRRHRIVLRNLELAFPDWSEAERGRVAIEHWRQIGRTFAEFPLMDRLTPSSGRVEVVGMERLRSIAASGEAAVLVSGHLSNWEVMMAVIVASGAPCRVSYRPANNPYTDRRITLSRWRYGVRMLAARGADGARELLGALHAGQSVAMLDDQRDSSGVEAPFFGRAVWTAPGPVRLALKYGGRLIPMSVARLKGARFRVTVHEPIVLERTGDRTRDIQAGMVQVNAFIEARIRERPAEWMWSHRRWPLECYTDLERSEAGVQPSAMAEDSPSSSLRRHGPA
jgi:KDO2-lipid IV(A) lauroyltransferase